MRIEGHSVGPVVVVGQPSIVPRCVLVSRCACEATAKLLYRAHVMCLQDCTVSNRLLVADALPDDALHLLLDGAEHGVNEVEVI